MRKLSVALGERNIAERANQGGSVKFVSVGDEQTRQNIAQDQKQKHAIHFFAFGAGFKKIIRI